VYEKDYAMITGRVNLIMKCFMTKMQVSDTVLWLRELIIVITGCVESCDNNFCA